MQYAGFDYPKSIYMLPQRKHGQSNIDALRSKHDLRKCCGPYYSNEPNPLPNKGRSFYLESDFAPGLRWQWCDEVEDVRIDHTGWFTDDYGTGDKIRGIVMRLPHGRGFLAGWSMGESMASSLDTYIWDNEQAAARDADNMAERAAEDQREYEAEENERIKKEEESE